MALHSELIRLFGTHTWKQAERLQPHQVNASTVQVAAGALLSLKGQPAKQIALVKTMEPSTAAALCRWLADPAFWGAVAAVTRH